MRFFSPIFLSLTSYVFIIIIVIFLLFIHAIFLNVTVTLRIFAVILISFLPIMLLHLWIWFIFCPSSLLPLVLAKVWLPMFSKVFIHCLPEVQLIELLLLISSFSLSIFSIDLSRALSKKDLLFPLASLQHSRVVPLLYSFWMLITNKRI